MVCAIGYSGATMFLMIDSLAVQQPAVCRALTKPPAVVLGHFWRAK